MLTGHQRYLPGYGLYQLNQDPLGFFQRLQQRHGDFVKVDFGGVLLFAVHHPDLIGEVLLQHATDFHKGRGLQVARRLVGNGLVTSEGEFHRQQRKVMQPCFHKSALSQYLPTISRCTEERTARWREGENLDLSSEFAAITLEIISRTMFGEEVGADTALVERCFSLNVSAFRAGLVPLMPWLERLPLPYFRRLARSRQQLDVVLLRLIENAKSDHLIGRLVEAGIPAQQVRDEAMTIFLAGHETTSNWLSWTWLLLARHPQVLAAVREELGEGPIDLAHLPLLKQVLQESLRLYPPAWTVGRSAHRPVTIGGVTIPRGATVIMSPWVVQRDPRWFADPEEFRPERWTSEFEKSLPKLAFFPFGAGSRVCLGEHFARLEAALILATVLQKFNLEARGPLRLQPEARITLRPAGGIPVRVRLREAVAHTPH